LCPVLSIGSRHGQRDGFRELALKGGCYMLRVVAFILTAIGALAQQPKLQKITISYPTRTGQVWPLYLAKEGGYYEKYGFDVNLAFGIHDHGDPCRGDAEGQVDVEAVLLVVAALFGGIQRPDLARAGRIINGDLLQLPGLRPGARRDQRRA